MDVKDLVSHFESLGDNCEFGVVQRKAGIEPLGFFRWNWTPLKALLGVLDDGFESVDPEKVEIVEDQHGEYIVQLPPWGFRYHTHHRVGSVEPEKLREQQVKVTEFLKRKALEDLRSGEKIFVRKGADTGSEAVARDIFRRLAGYGRNRLLWVVAEDAAHPSGTVEMLESGLMRGHIDRFAPPGNAHDSSPAWFGLCRQALALTHAACPSPTFAEEPAADARG